MEIFYTTQHLSVLFTIDWNSFNATLVLQLRKQLEVLDIKLYQKLLGLESLSLRRWYRNLCLFYKVFKKQHPECLFHSIPVRRAPYTTRNVLDFLRIFKSKNIFFGKDSFFASSISEWNKLDPSLRNSQIFLTFKENIRQFIRTAANCVYNCHNPKGIKLITRLRVSLNHLREHKFKYNSQEPLNPICNCGPLSIIH